MKVKSKICKSFLKLIVIMSMMFAFGALYQKGDTTAYAYQYDHGQNSMTYNQWHTLTVTYKSTSGNNAYYRYVYWFTPAGRAKLNIVWKTNHYEMASSSGNTIDRVVSNNYVYNQYGQANMNTSTWNYSTIEGMAAGGYGTWATVFRCKSQYGTNWSTHSANGGHWNATLCNVYWQKPTVSISQSGQYVNPGTTVTFTASAWLQSSSGWTSGPVSNGWNAANNGYTYQWYRNGVAISGATSSTYSRTFYASDHNTYYQCVVTNTAGGTWTSSAYVYVNNVWVNNHPTDYHTWHSAGKTAQFYANGGAYGTISYKWQYRTSSSATGVTELASSGTDQWNGYSTSGTSTLTLGSSGGIHSNWSGHQIRCRISSAYGGANLDVYTNWATLYAYAVPTASVWADNQAGSSARVNCTLSSGSGVSNIKYPTWTEPNGQDDIVYYEVGSGPISSNVTVNASSHGGQGGSTKYITHVYVYTASGVSAYVGMTEFIMGYKPTLNSSYPKDVTVKVPVGSTTSSSDATFSISVSTAGSPATYTYQWYKASSSTAAGSAISGATGSSYTIPKASITKSLNGTYYYCIVKHVVGNSESRHAKLTVQYPPVLDSTKPADVSVNSGGNASFTVSISTGGNPASYTYQWYKNGTAISGATSTTYTEKSCTSSMSGNKYYCAVTHTCGTQNSRTATLTVNAKKPVLSGPNYSSYKAEVIEGKTATFYVSISEQGLPTDYAATWYYRTNSSASWQKCADSSFKANCTYSQDSKGFTMNIANVNRNMHGYEFRLSVKNEGGKYETITNNATLIVYYDPTFSQPQNLIVKENTTASFTVNITNKGNNGNIKAEWYKVTPSGTTTLVKTETSTATSFTYSFTAVKGDNGNKYYCALTPDKTNKKITTDQAKLTVYYPPVLDSSKPANLVLNDGSSGSFKVSVSTAGNPNSYTYQWYSMASGSSSWTKITSSGTSTTLSVTATKAMNGTKYKCTVSQSASMSGSNTYTASVDSRTATLTVYYAPVLNSSYPKDVATVFNKEVSFEVKIATAGNPNSYTYQWYKKASASASGTAISGATSAKYTIASASVVKGLNNTYYYCVVSTVSSHATYGKYTLTSRTAKLTVYYPPVLNSSYPQDVTKKVGETATFSVSISTAGNPTSYSYQWYENSSNATTGGTAISGGTSSTLTLSSLAKEKNGKYYYCIVSNSGGSVYSRAAKLTVQYVPVLNSSYPANATVNSGATASFSVSISTAGNPASYTYQWYQNGSAISGATSSSYTTAAATSGMNGYTYYCKVTNSAGTVTSRTATLTVRFVPVLNSSYPANATVNVGATATFKVEIATAGNPATYTYQWYKGSSSTDAGSAISGATGSSYTTPATAKTDNGKYFYCKVTNTRGTVESRHALLTVRYVPILNSSYPANTTVIAGNKASFSVSISTAGNPASYTYQWYQNGTAISGATASSYTTAATTKSMNGYTYYCKVTNSAGTVTSRTATLTVKYVPVLDSTYPQDAVVIEGNSAAFTVKISTAGNPASYTYQWQWSADGSTWNDCTNVSSGTFNGMSGATTTNLTLGTTGSKLQKAWDGYRVRCIVKNEAGSVTSRVAKLTTKYIPVLNSSYPKDATVIVGNKTTFSVSISTAGYPATYTYRWYQNGSVISGATSSSYTTGATTKDMNGYTYYCIVTNEAGNVQSRTAKLTVQYTPIMNTSYPKDTTVISGKTASFAISVATAGNPASYSYQWYKGNSSTDAGTAISGATSSSYATPATTKSDNNTYYYCKVTNTAGTVETRHAKLTVHYLPVLDSTLPKNVTVVVGATASFSVSITTAGNPASYTYQWYQNSSAISGATSSSYTTGATTSAMNGYKYYCAVKNSAGTVNSRTATLTVYYPPILNSSYPADTTVVVGNKGTFEVKIATAGNPASYTYQWYQNSSAISGATSSSYTTGATTKGMNGYKYYCIVKNSGGQVTSRTATLTVHFPPVLNSSYPANATVVIGNKATFSVSISTAGNPASYTYQWYQNGSAISGATGSSYTTGATTKGMNGYTYYCIVKNSGGSVQSRTATLTVYYPPVLDSSYPKDTTVITGNTAKFEVKISTAGNPVSYSYQWYKSDGTLINGATSASYSLTGTKAITGSKYYCIVKNSGGQVTSRTATLHVLYPNELNPLYPQDTTVVVGNKATFKVVIEGAGTGTPSYQWYKSTDGKNSGGTAISGATSATYTTSATTSKDNNTYYYCIVSNDGGTTTSRAAKLTVYYPVTLNSSYPADVTVVIGNTAKFTISVSTDGNPASYTYQWYKGTSATDAGTAISGATGSSYTTPATTKSDNNTYYYVKVTNSGGTTESRHAKLTVYYPPVLNGSYPQNTTVVVGNKGSFEVKISTAGNPASYTYQWYQNGSAISGATSSSYTTVATTKAMNGYTYYCVVKNSGGQVTSRTAKLTVHFPPVLDTSLPANTTVIEGNSAYFKVAISTAGNPTSYSYQWQSSSNGSTWSNLVNSSTASTSNWNGVSGATTANLTLGTAGSKIIRNWHGWQVRCIVSNSGGQVTSRAATLTVYHLPTLDSTLPKDTTVVIGNKATFNVSITTAGNPNSYTYQWYQNDVAISGATQSSYTTGATTKDMNGYKYNCKVTNAAGTVTSRKATLTVHYPPVLHADYPKNAVIVIGSTSSFEVKIATAGNPASYTYQWYLNGSAISGATGSTYTTGATSKAMNGYKYYCVVKNAGGQVTSRTALLTVYYPPVLNTSYPKDVAAFEEKTVSFEVVIATKGNPESYTYQWYENGTAIPNATQSSYSMVTERTDDKNQYYCKVTNAGGTVTSRSATLRVWWEATLDASYPKDVVEIEGNPVTYEIKIVVAGNPASYVYQWYQADAIGVQGTALTNQTNPIYNTTAHRSMNNKYYYCTVTNVLP